MHTLSSLAATHLSAILTDAILLAKEEHVLVIYDTDAPLTRIILEGYKLAAPMAEFMDFHAHTPAQILERISMLKPNDLVVVLQSTNFRLNEFRLRIELFQRQLKTIEHLHLERLDEDQFERYILSLAYDKTYYHTHGHTIKRLIDSAKEVVVSCAGTSLTYSGGMEDAKLNIGDYRGMKNVGGTYPIGEVFTEAKILENTEGEVQIFGYASFDHKVRIVPPFRGYITKGIFTAPDAPEDFQQILDLVRTTEPVWVRELGLGLNKAMGKHALVNDITAFERQVGVHLSLGAKHGIYAKPGFGRKDGKYHIDVFVDVEKIMIDDTLLYANGNYLVDAT